MLLVRGSGLSSWMWVSISHEIARGMHGISRSTCWLDCYLLGTCVVGFEIDHGRGGWG